MARSLASQDHAGAGGVVATKRSRATWTASPAGARRIHQAHPPPNLVGRDPAQGRPAALSFISTTCLEPGRGYAGPSRGQRMEIVIAANDLGALHDSQA